MERGPKQRGWGKQTKFLWWKLYQTISSLAICHTTLSIVLIKYFIYSVGTHALSEHNCFYQRYQSSTYLLFPMNTLCHAPDLPVFPAQIYLCRVALLSHKETIVLPEFWHPNGYKLALFSIFHRKFSHLWVCHFSVEFDL